ncbi:carboxypeptidase B-like [Palaemon carinicauda]|uniref:carboxypeptidase B-like n=1 Tax=Palaemon carinicauda TaxID=392227 RepID=UPI0035B5AF95
MMALILWTLFLCCRLALGSYQNLVGHQIWKLSGKESALPGQLMTKGLLDILDHSRKLQRVRVAPEHLDRVSALLQKDGISYKILVDDLAAHIEGIENSERRRRDVSENQQTCTESDCPEPLSDVYMRFNEMEWYLKQVNETYYPNVTLSSVGKSHENRDIWVLHIKSENPEARSIWIEGGIHARERISPAVAFGLIPKLLSDKNATERFDFFVAPMANPDGYEYTFTGDRMWRKNRRVNQNERSSCYGVDLNRNWDFKFGVGASSYHCSEVYMGPFPFSEPETKALSDAMLEQKDTLLMLFSLHSYGQDLLYPWGWTSTEDAPNKNELIEVGRAFADGAQEIAGHDYEVVNSAGGLYYASGATDDWALGKMGVKYVYTLELQDKGSRGFLLESEAIKPSIEEVWNGFKKALEIIG